MIRNPELRTRGGAVGGLGAENLVIHSKVDGMGILDAPPSQESGQDWTRNEGAFESVVKSGDVFSTGLLCDRDSERPHELSHGAEDGFRKVRVVKANNRDIEATTGGDGLPCDLIGVAGFNDIGSFFFQDLFDEVKLREGAVA